MPNQDINVNGIPVVIMIGLVNLIAKEHNLNAKQISAQLFGDLCQALLPVYRDLMSGKYDIRPDD